jgi:hypothetical protein
LTDHFAFEVRQKAAALEPAENVIPKSFHPDAEKIVKRGA